MRTEARGCGNSGGTLTQSWGQQASEGIVEEESELAMGNGSKGLSAAGRPRAESRAGGQNVGSVAGGKPGRRQCQVLKGVVRQDEVLGLPCRQRGHVKGF